MSETDEETSILIDVDEDDIESLFDDKSLVAIFDEYVAILEVS